MLKDNHLQSEQKNISQTMTQNENDGSWLQINQCPSCSCLSKINRGKIPLDFTTLLVVNFKLKFLKVVFFCMSVKIVVYYTKT